MFGATRYPVPTVAANVAASPAGRWACAIDPAVTNAAINRSAKPKRCIEPSGAEWYPCGFIVATLSRMPGRVQWGLLLTKLYPWALATILSLFVWQVVAARRAAPPPPPADVKNTLSCNTVMHDVMLGELPEASGLALSVRTPGVIWSMNDSGVPLIYGLDAMGRVVGRIRVSGADINNWEDISVAPCAGKSCLYVADTGNGGGTQRNDVVLYRMVEPAPTDANTAAVETFNAAYPSDEDHESEAMFVAGGQLFLVTKGHPSLVFRFPRGMEKESLATPPRARTGTAGSRGASGPFS